MFDLLDRPLHWITVAWPGLAQGENESLLSVPTKHEVQLRVELLDKQELKTLFPIAFGEQTEAPDDLTLFKRVVREWRKVAMSGRAAPMTDENVERLLGVPMFAPAFGEAYVNAVNGRVEVREGNSQGSPGGGPQDEAPLPTKTSSNATAAASA